jgi:hypothetical protein
VLVVESQKDAVTLEEGDVFVVNRDLGTVDDLLERSTTLSGFEGVWHVKVFCSDTIRTDVRNRLDEGYRGKAMR